MQFLNRLIRSESYSDQVQIASHLNDVSKLLLPFESKIGGIKQNLDHLSSKLNSIPEKITSENINRIQFYLDEIKSVENRILGVTKELTNIQSENRRFANLHNDIHASMVKMRNIRFGNITMLAKRITDRTAEIHSSLQTTEKRDLSRTLSNIFPQSEQQDIQAFVEGWRGGDGLVDYIKGSDSRKTISVLRQRRNAIQTSSRTLVHLYDHMHTLSSILAAHQELMNDIELNVDETNPVADDDQSEFERMIGISTRGVTLRKIIAAVCFTLVVVFAVLIVMVIVKKRRKR